MIMQSGLALMLELTFPLNAFDSFFVTRLTNKAHTPHKRVAAQEGGLRNVPKDSLTARLWDDSGIVAYCAQLAVNAHNRAHTDSNLSYCSPRSLFHDLKREWFAFTAPRLRKHVRTEAVKELCRALAGHREVALKDEDGTFHHIVLGRASAIKNALNRGIAHDNTIVTVYETRDLYNEPHQELAIVW